MQRKFSNYLLFAAAVVLLAGGLKLAGWLPMLTQRDLMRKYASVEDVRAELSIREIHVPSYFPQNLSWPPSTVLAQGKPFPALIMEFEQAGGKSAGLVISQSRSASFRTDGRIRIAQLKEKVDYPLKGRVATLEVGTCGNGEPCSRVSWTEGNTYITVSARSTPLELIKVAESMLR
ncbi:MAG: hypothetical protein ACM319_02465 [Deltaproteobacteria bacterium]|nr:hypothetical protein [Candidatus Deferrimicrobiaceae bacterium]